MKPLNIRNYAISWAPHASSCILLRPQKMVQRTSRRTARWKTGWFWGGQRAAEVYLMITSAQVFVYGGFGAGFVTGAVWNAQHQVCDDPCQEMRKANRLKLGADIVMLLSLIPESKELRAEGMQLEEEAEMLRAEADAEAEAAAESKAGGGPGAAKDRSLQGRQDQLEGLEKHQDQVTKKGGYRISKGKSKLDFKHGLNQIKTSKDVEDQ